MEKNAEIIECRKVPEWEEEKLVAWIISQANGLGKKISRTCAELLIEFVGFDLGVLSSEIEKLSVYLKDREEIKKEDIEEIVPRTGYDAFTLSSALGEKNRKKSYEALQKLFTDREDPIALFGLISSQFRNLYKAKLLKKQNLNNFQAAKILKANPYYIGKLMAYSDNFKEDELERSLDLLCQTDLRLKSGFDPMVEFSLLLLELKGEKG
jgi:DNA polymerase-3 subunit delta